MIDYVPFNEGEFIRWIQDLGDQVLRLRYDLTPDSVVVDAGGYVGQFADDIHKRYQSTVYVLEPLENLHYGIVSRFRFNSKIVPCNFALGNKNCEMSISIDIDNDSNSMYIDDTEKKETIKCVDVKDFLNEYNITHIDLFKINIEGGEFDLLERMIELDLINKVRNFQIQFHRFIPECAERRDGIQQALSKTHNLTWNYDWIWENWSLKN